MATYSESGSAGNNSSRGGTGLLGAGSGQKDYDYLFKLLIIADSGVGKSSLLVRFSDNTFTENYVTTIGVDFKIRTVTIDDIKIKLQIWDTAGQERFRTITSTYYRGTHGVIVVFDLTNGETFSNIRRWLQEIENNCDTVPKVLVGNKCEDIAHRAVTEEDARNLANAIKIQYFETSAKDNINVQQMFDCITKMVLDTKLKASGGPNRSEGIKLTKKRSNGAKKKCCM